MIMDGPTIVHMLQPQNSVTFQDYKGNGNGIPTLLIDKKTINTKLFELECDFLVVTNYNYIKNGLYDDNILSNELHFYKRKYRYMYFISQSGGWKSCVHFSYLANRSLISGGGGHQALPQNRFLLNEKTIKIMEENNSKLLFYYGNKYDINCLSNLENSVLIKINKYSNPFYKEKTHGIFNKPFLIDNYVKFIRRFFIVK